MEDKEKAPQEAKMSPEEEIFHFVYSEQIQREMFLAAYGLYCFDPVSPLSIFNLQEDGEFNEKILRYSAGKERFPIEEYTRNEVYERNEYKELAEKGKKFLVDWLNSDYLAEAKGKVQEYLSQREETVREAFIPYIEKALSLLDCLGKGDVIFFRNSYGWNMEDFQKRYIEGKGYEYRAPEELTETDRKALSYEALQVYYIAEDIVGSIRSVSREIADYLQKGIKILDKEEEKNKAPLTKIPDSVEKEVMKEAVDLSKRLSNYVPYPFTGRSRTEIVEDILSYRDDLKTDQEAIDLDCWGCVEYYLPFLVHRLDYALYLAFRYSGEEYREYLDTLDFEEDFNRYQRETTTEGTPETFGSITGRGAKC